MQLYKLTDQYQELYSLLSETEGEEAECLHEILALIADDIEGKFENLAKLCQNISGVHDMIEAEEKRLAKKRAALNHALESLKAYVLSQMTILKMDSVGLPPHKWAVQNNGGKAKLIIEEGAEIPPEFMYTPDPLPDNEQIRAEIERYESLSEEEKAITPNPVPFAKLERGKHVRIK